MANTMTERDFMNKVISSNASEELVEYAKAYIAKLDARNEKKKATPTKAQVANAEIKKQIVELLKDGAKTASQVGETLSVSTQKASALLVQLVNEGTLVSTEVKVKGKGSVKSYSVKE